MFRQSYILPRCGSAEVIRVGPAQVAAAEASFAQKVTPIVANELMAFGALHKVS